MTQALYLALRSLRWHRGRAVIIVFSLALTLWLPVSVRMVLDQFRREITARAAATPLVIGARGSRLDLAVHALYFQGRAPADVTMADVRDVQDQGLGLAIPLHVHHRTQSQPGRDGAVIVGTSPEYLEFRGLRTASGSVFALLGECVVGAGIAERLHLKPGDSLFSAPRNALDLAGDYPLKMTVTGVLARAHSPDDMIVFTDLQTTWLIDGIGHGHQDVSPLTDPALLLDVSRVEPGGSGGTASSPGLLTANAGVLPFTEITDANRDSFHFHGDPDTFPVSAIIVAPPDARSRTLLLGRYQSSGAAAQCLRPPDVIAELLGVVFRVEQFAWLCSLLAAAVTILLLGLVVSLSMKLRAAEMATFFRLGCSRKTIAMLYATELGLLLLAAATLASCGAIAVVWLASDMIRSLLF
jgi:putative ABC transport system permease protein